MSASSDTSIASKRQNFVALVGEAGGVALITAAALLLDLQSGATFAQGAAQLQQRSAGGLAGV